MASEAGAACPLAMTLPVGAVDPCGSARRAYVSKRRIVINLRHDQIRNARHHPRTHLSRDVTVEGASPAPLCSCCLLRPKELKTCRVSHEGVVSVRSRPGSRALVRTSRYRAPTFDYYGMPIHLITMGFPYKRDSTSAFKGCVRFRVLATRGEESVISAFSGGHFATLLSIKVSVRKLGGASVVRQGRRIEEFRR